MKAARTHGRGGPEQIFVEDAPMPDLQPGDALVRVIATGITPAELTWDATYQHPDGSARVPSTLGHEVSGVVESVSAGVTDLHAGDEVYGLCEFARDGAAAEYVAVPASNLARKPRLLDAVRTAALPLSALTAWQALFDHAGLAAGQRVLIHGGAGGVGSLAVQLARWRGASVIATARAGDAEFVTALGAEQVIDYEKQRFEELVGNVDVVLDPIGGETRERSWRVLRRGGILVTLPSPVAAGEAEQYHVRGVFFIVTGNRMELAEIANLVDAGHLRPLVAAVLPLAQARVAFARAAAGPNRGKIVLQVAS